MTFVCRYAFYPWPYTVDFVDFNIHQDLLGLTLATEVNALTRQTYEQHRLDIKKLLLLLSLLTKYTVTNNITEALYTVNGKSNDTKRSAVE